MPFRIDSITYADEYNSGTTTQLTSVNVSDEITATIQITFESLIDADLDATWTIDGANFNGNQVFFLDNISPLPQEFQGVGQVYYYGAEIKIDISGSVSTFNIDYVTDASLLPFGISFGKSGRAIVCTQAASLTGNYAAAKIWISEAITDCNLDYRVSGTGNNNDYVPPIEINDNQPANFKTTSSPLDSTDTVTVHTIPFTYNGAYKTGSLTIRGLGNGTYSQSFELIHTFRVVPISIYNDGSTQPDDFSLPANIFSNLFFLDQEGRYGIRGNFSNQVNGGLQLSFDTGSISPKYCTFGFKNGGGNTNYSVTNFDIVRTSDSLSSGVPLVTSKFTVSFDLENATDTPFSDTNTLVKVGIENIPSEVDNSEDYEQTILHDWSQMAVNTTPTPVVGNATGDAASITNYTATYNSTSSVSISFDVDFTANAETQIISGNGSYYFSIYTQVQDHLKNYTNSDRVTLQVFSGLGIDDILEDPIVIDSASFITAPYTNIADAIDVSEVNAFPVQLLVGAVKFYADWTDRDALRLDKLTQYLVFKNSSTGEEIELTDTKEEVNLASFPLIDSKYPNANYSKGKGFKIPIDEVRNLVRVYNDGDVSNAHYYQTLFPFFIRWEYYKRLFLDDIPAELIDNTQDFDGINYFLNRIDGIANWDLFYRLRFNSSQNSSTFEQDFDYQLQTNNYNTHDDVVSRSLVSKTTDGTSLNISGTKYILSDSYTELTATWEMSTTQLSTSDFTIEFYIEAYENGSPTAIQRISSENNITASSWFIDTGAGDGLIVKSIDGVNAIGKAYINNETLAKYDSYRVYYQIYNPNKIPLFTFYTESNVPTDTFDPSFTTTGGETVTFTLLGTDGVAGYTQTTNTLSIAARTGLSGTPSTLAADELEGTSQAVEVSFSTNKASNITQIDFNNDDISETLDLSLFTNCTAFRFFNNNITSVICPTSSVSVNILYLYSNNITGTLDLRGFSNLNSDIRFSTNPLLTSVLFPSIPNAVNVLYGNNCGLTSLDLSGFSDLAGDIRFSSNTSMGNPTFPTASTRATTFFQFISCGISGAFDISMFQQLGGDIRLGLNSITSLTLPTASTTNITTFDIQQNSISGTLNMSGLGGLGGAVSVNNNSITSITMPASSTGTLQTWNSLGNGHGYVDLTVFASIDVNSLSINMSSNAMSAANVQSVIDDLDSVLGTAGTGTNSFNFSSQSPALTAGEKTTIQGTASYISLTSTKGYTILL